MNLGAKRLFEQLTERASGPYIAALSRMIVAKVRGTRLQFADARADFAEVMRETMGVAEVLGATLVLQRAAQFQGEFLNMQSLVLRDWSHGPGGELIRFGSADTQRILPRVTFKESVRDMVARTPEVIKDAAERTAQRISQLYSQGHAVAFVRSAEEAVTERAQVFIAEALRRGIPEGEAGAGLAMAAGEASKDLEPWSRAYARMAFRTNVNTAVTAGRFRQVQDPEIAEVIPAMRFGAVGDDDTRENHLAADGVILSATNPAWSEISPPLGYNCRCQVFLMSVPALRRAGAWKEGRLIESRVPSAAGPDEGFRHGGRADLFMESV